MITYLKVKLGLDVAPLDIVCTRIFSVDHIVVVGYPKEISLEGMNRRIQADAT